MPRILSQNDVVSLLTIPDVIQAVESGFKACASGDFNVPVRLPVDVPDREAVVLFMPAYLPQTGTLGAKIVSVFPGNSDRKLPVIMGVYLVHDADSGQLLAIMDATYITGIRTAAASAVATKHLARRDAGVLGVLGAGVQARFHVHAISTILDIQEIVVYNRSWENGTKFVEMLREKYPRVHQVQTAEACVQQSGVIATCTRTSTPLFEKTAIQPGTHINAVGAYTPDMRELSTDTICGSKIVVDTYEGAMTEAGDLLIPIKQGHFSQEEIYADLCEVITQSAKGRASEEEITVFKSVGFAMEDAVTARLAYERALERNVGVDVDL